RGRPESGFLCRQLSLSLGKFRIRTSKGICGKGRPEDSTTSEIVPKVPNRLSTPILEPFTSGPEGLHPSLSQTAKSGLYLGEKPPDLTSAGTEGRLKARDKAHPFG